MRQCDMRRALGTVMAASLATLAIQPRALAEGAAAQLEEIIVTALRRDSTMIDTPAAVSVMTAAMIEDAGITRPADFVSFVPNMNITNVNRAGEAFVTIRGLAQARSADSIVAVIVDGVQLASAEELNQELFDIQQIEVLKGPQGALYGRNAIGGAIVIKTKSASDEFQASARGGYGNDPDDEAQTALFRTGFSTHAVLAQSTDNFMAR